MFVILSDGHSNFISFFNHLNILSPYIQFTMEPQKGNSMPFLDVLISRRPNGSLSHQVYRKRNDMDIYLHASSHHNPGQKFVVVKNLHHLSHSYLRTSIPHTRESPPNKIPYVQWILSFSNKPRI
jgi:hypothetical protein